MKQQHTSLATPSVQLRPLASFLKELGVTSITGWRWRKRAWIKTVTIAGRQYISESEIAEFNRRAETGEFEKLTKLDRESYRWLSLKSNRNCANHR